MPVSVTLPVLVSVKAWVGSKRQANISAAVVPGQLRTCCGLQLVGVRFALITTGTAKPVRFTGELATVKPPSVVMVTLPLNVPAFGGAVNTMLIVHDAALFSVAPQVPPAVPAGRENGAARPVIVKVRGPPVELRTVSVWAVLVVLTTWVNVSDAGVTAMLTPVPVRVTGLPVTVAPV